MTVSTGNFAELLWPGILDIYGATYDRYPKLYTKVFTVKKSERAFEKVQGVTGLPLASVKTQGGAVNYVDPYQGYQKEYVNVTYAIGATVTEEMYDDDQYDYINMLPEMLAESMNQTEETIAFNVLNNGFSAGNFAGPDGVAFFSASHPLIGGGLLSNVLAVAADIGQTAVETLVMQIQDSVDDMGLKANLSAKSLVVATGDNFKARKLQQSTQIIGSADNDPNLLKGLFDQVVTAPYLTDPDAWFITTNVKNGLTFMNRRAARLQRDNDFDTKNLKFTVTRRFSAGVTDTARAAYASQGA